MDLFAIRDKKCHQNSIIFSRSVAKIHLGQLDCFELGNLDSLRDWGHAKDFVRAMWEMLQVGVKI